MPEPPIHTSAVDVYRRLLGYVARYWRYFAVAILGMLVEAAGSTAFAALIKPMLDGSFVEKDAATISWIPYALVAVFLVRGMGSFVAQVFMNRAGRNVTRDLRRDIFAHLLVLPVPFYNQSTSSKLVSKLIYDTEQVFSAATSALLILFRDNLTIAGLLGLMLWYNWKLSLFFFVFVPVVALVALKISRRLRRIARRIQHSMGDVTTIAQEAIDGQRVIKTYGTQDYERNHFNAVNQSAARQQMKLAITGAAAEPVTLLFGALAFAGVLFVVTQPEARAEFTVGTFMSFITALMLLFAPIKRLTKINTTTQKGIAAAQAIFELLDTPAEHDTGTRTLDRAQGRIEYRDVTFRYGDGPPVLDGVTIMIAPGQTVALVGKSGSGKSTLVNLLPRFYDVTSGAILLDGIDVRELRLADLRRQIAYVSQDITLFNDSIAQNIAYGRLHELRAGDVEAAAKAAHAHDFIMKLPQGYDTRVGENGVLLSGGQRQRLAIARALLKNAPVLILDEATSALDSESEQHIQAALEHLTANRTTLVIAHRLATIERADCIVVLDAGRIAEQGTHAELLRAGGLYAQLHRRQFRSVAAG